MAGSPAVCNHEAVRTSEPGESGLNRVMRILEVFNTNQSVFTPAEIARRTGLPIATTYRIVNEMVLLGILEKAPQGVRTGVRLWELASRGSRILSLRNTALPFMEDIQNALRQHTQLAVLDGTDILYLERLSAPEDAVVNITHVAGRLPAVVCAPGLVLTAFSSPDVQDAVLATTPPQFTRLTPTDTSRFPALLADIRRQGFARVDGWVNEGVTGVSAPIRDAEGSVIAALAVLLPNDGKTPRMALPAIQIAAAGISRALGFTPGTVKST